MFTFLYKSSNRTRKRKDNRHKNFSYKYGGGGFFNLGGYDRLTIRLSHGIRMRPTSKGSASMIKREVIIKLRNYGTLTRTNEGSANLVQPKVQGVSHSIFEN